MAKQPWEIPDPPQVGDATNDITFQAVGAALSQWEYFEGYLSLTFSYLIGAGYKNVAAMRAYGSVQTFRGRHDMIENAAEIYFLYNAEDEIKSELKGVLNAGLVNLRLEEMKLPME